MLSSPPYVGQLLFTLRRREAGSPAASSRRRGQRPGVERTGPFLDEKLLLWLEFTVLDLPHRQVVFTIPRMLRTFFKYNRRLLGELCRLALRSLTRYFEVLTGSELRPGVIAAIQTFGDRINLHPHLHFLVTEGGVMGKMPERPSGWTTWSSSPESPPIFLTEARSQFGLYANAHRGKLRKASLEASPLRMMEEELRPIPAKGWAEMIRKVYEVDPMVCPRCGGTMKVIAFLTDHKVVDKIIDHLKLTFIAERPPPAHIAYQEVLMAAEAPTEYSS